MAIPKKIVFLGTKPIGAHCLAFLLEQQSVLNIEVIAIGTQHRKEFSTENAIEVLAHNNHIPLINHPDEIPACDIIYVVQYHKILKNTHINQAKQIAVNLHLAPLPEYRGCNQFSFAIFHGATTFGVSIHKIDSGIDSGDILFEDRFPLAPNTWVKDLFNTSVNKGIALFKATLADIVAENYTLTPQSKLIAQRGLNEHKRKDIQALKQIDFNESKEKTQKRIRATLMPGFEPPFVIIDGKKFYITAADEQ